MDQVRDVPGGHVGMLPHALTLLFFTELLQTWLGGMPFMLASDLIKAI